MFGEDIIKSVVDIAGKFIPDKDLQAKAEAELRIALLAADTQLAIAQTEINKIEATSDDKFKSYWRPATGWCCVIALFYHYILQPIIIFGMAIYGYQVQLPIFDMETLNTVLYGLLGLGTMRTVERLPWKLPKV